MFFRVKPAGDRRYLQIVENRRDGAKTRQTVVATLGRLDELEASGKLDVLLRRRPALRDGHAGLQPAPGHPRRGIDPAHWWAPLAFARVREETGRPAVIEAATLMPAY